MTPKRTSLALALLVLLGMLGSIAVAAVPTGRQISQNITGANADRVEVLSRGRKRGEIRAVADGTWEERTSPASDRPVNDRVFVYQERSRNDQAIVLHDAYRGIELELNIAARKVYYSDNNIRRQEIYDIGSATRTEFVDGRDIRYLSFTENPDQSALGTLSNEDGDLWVMREGTERAFFYERFRSESMIELRDYTNSAVFRFNLANLTAVLSGMNGRQSRSGTIVDLGNEVPAAPAKPAVSGNRPNGQNVMQMTLGINTGEYGQLVREPSQVWTIRTGNGNVIERYYETGRSDWTVELSIDPAGTRPALRADLYEMLVYSSRNNKPIYVIPGAFLGAVPTEPRVVRTTQFPPSQDQGNRPPVAIAPPPSPHAQLGQVTYGENGTRVGAYSNLGDGRWQDSNIYGGSLILTEERRSNDAVYLKVPDRNETIQLNLTTRRIYRLTSASTAALYEIISTAPLAQAPAAVSTPAQVRVATATPGPATRSSPPAPLPSSVPGAPVPVASTPTAPATAPQGTRPAAPVPDRQPLPPPVKLDTQTNPRLARASTSPADCGREGQRPCSASPATFVQAAAAGGCPAGSDLFPLVRSGSCWSCPEGSRYFAPSDIEGPRACTIPATQSRAAARFTGLVEMFRCPNGGAARGLDNKCWQCPDGFLPDILEQADGPRGCFRDNAAQFTAAELTRTLACPPGSNAELLDNGNCWSCPAGFSRSGSPPSWPDACTTNIWDATFASLGAGSCAAGLENFRGVCERRGSCGAIGGRPCEIGERVPSCDEGAREDFKTNSCVALKPGESPFIAGLGSVSEFYGDSIVLFCRQAIGGIQFDSSTDLGLGANCAKDMFTGAGCEFLADSLGGGYADMVGSAASIGPQFETFKSNVDEAYLAAPCNSLTETLRPAVNHGAASGLDCPANQFWDPNGSCYSCPDGFSRTMNPVTSPGACVDKPGNELARSACAVFRAATQDLENAALCSKEVLESGTLLERPLDLSGAQAEVCLAAGEFAYSIYSVIKPGESAEKKSGRILDALNRMLNTAKSVQDALGAVDAADNLGTAFNQLAHCK